MSDSEELQKLLNGPQIVMLQKGMRCEIFEFDSAEEAHDFATSKVGEWGRVVIAARVRVLETVRHRDAYKRN